MTANNGDNCCSCGSGCCGAGVGAERRQVIIDFLYLDLSVCTRCQGTDQSLEEGLQEVSKVLESAGVDVVVNKQKIATMQEAIDFKFASSPTIRVNGQDIQLDVKESLCESCGDLCGGDVDCRVWTYQGVEYTVAPKPMIVEAILRAVYGTPKEEAVETGVFQLPENLYRFFTLIEEKAE